MKPTARRRVDARRRPSRAHHPSSRAPPTLARALALSRPGRASHLELDPPLPLIGSRAASIRPVSRLGPSRAVFEPRSTARETSETSETSETTSDDVATAIGSTPTPTPRRDETRDGRRASVDRSRSRSIESRIRAVESFRSYLRGDGGARDALLRARGSRRERDQSGVQRQGDHGVCVSSASDDVTRRVRLARASASRVGRAVSTSTAGRDSSKSRAPYPPPDRSIDRSDSDAAGDPMKKTYFSIKR